MPRADKRRRYRSALLKHAIIIMIVSFLTWLLVLIAGNFVDLHPNAYRDLIRSILIPYGFGIAVYSSYKSLYERGSQERIINKITVWWETGTPLEAAFELFTLITLLNSLMMITGYDTPKEGVFAYIHMITRLIIVLLIVSLIMWKDIVQGIKSFKINNYLKDFFSKAHEQIFLSVSAIFTAVTISYCLIMITF